MAAHPSGWRPTDSLALRVWVVRRQLGLSQREFAVKCGLTFGEVQSLENGAHVRDEVRKIKSIARGTGADEGWLRDGGPLADGGYFPPEPVTAGTTIGRNTDRWLTDSFYVLAA